MPVILSRDAVAAWLDTRGVEAREAMGLVRPCPDDWLDVVPVSPRVNNVRNDDPTLQEPLAEPVAAPVSSEAPKAAKPRSSDEDEQGRLL
jgi:hypothetical protein